MDSQKKKKKKSCNIKWNDMICFSFFHSNMLEIYNIYLFHITGTTPTNKNEPKIGRLSWALNV